MDWKEDIMSNIYVFPRGIQRAGYNKGETVKWTSKYGSVITTGYDIGTCDGMNEKGLVAGLLFLPESVYDRPGDTRPVMGISIWTQYVLDNFATVREAVNELKKETSASTLPECPTARLPLHLAITDETGNTAILEYLDGKLSIHEGKEYRVMTNSPRYEYQWPSTTIGRKSADCRCCPEPTAPATALYARHSTFMPFRRQQTRRLQSPAY